MKVYVLEREQWIPAPPERAFPFFADAANLEAITPPWVGYRIHTPLPIEMRRDARIDYTLRLAGVPLRWCTRIVEWSPPFGFVDVQERGPYGLWEHSHRFEPLGAGVLMRDHVRWALPLGPLGRLAYVPVRAALGAIFDYRFDRIRERFATARNEAAA
jgi:ligand-binding SRPBCC domain-containing protein